MRKMLVKWGIYHMWLKTKFALKKNQPQRTHVSLGRIQVVHFISVTFGYKCMIYSTKEPVKKYSPGEWQLLTCEGNVSEMKRVTQHPSLKTWRKHKRSVEERSTGRELSITWFRMYIVVAPGKVDNEQLGI